MDYAVAVLDIGKTNKKLLVFDPQLSVVHQSSRRIDTRTHEGLDLEDIAAIDAWMLEELRDAAGKFPIRAITVATHGATVVCTDSEGSLAVPCLAYTNEVDEDFHQRFANTIGEPARLHTQTATAEVRPLINLAKLLFFQKERWPQGFARTTHIHPFPQYFTWRLSGVASAESTYLGSHTYLLDPYQGGWSPVVDALGIRSKLPERIGRPTDVLGTVTPEIADKTGLDPATVVLSGIHDSNASILPHLISRDGDFVLNSTGTWCVAMHPSERVHFQLEEIGRMVFFNMSYAGQPIKTSILLGGLEYDTYRLMLEERNPGWAAPGFSVESYGRILSERRVFVLPSVVRGAGQFPDSTARIVEGSDTFGLDQIQIGGPVPAILDQPDDAIAAVNISVAIQTSVALKRTGLKPGTPIYVEGGFRRNEGYLAVLSACLPDNPLSLTTLDEATSAGAALTAIAAVESVPVEDLARRVHISEEALSPASLPDVRAYADAFLAMLE